jgi:release factor H-coupled RctB family protein
MPSRAVTVILNYNQSKRFVLLLSTLSPDTDHDVILREARNKFRAKLTSAFLIGGTLLGSEDLPESVKQVWVGKGEPYCGPPGAAAALQTSVAGLHLIRCVYLFPSCVRNDNHGSMLAAPRVT